MSSDALEAVSAGHVLTYDADVQKCADQGFCQRLRGQPGDTYSVVPKSIELHGAVATATVKHDESGTAYDLRLTNYNGILRMHMDEAASKHRFEVPWVLQSELPDSSQVWSLASCILTEAGLGSS